MGRKPRDDHPGAWHHVYNRGIAQRPVFEDPKDYRAFLALLAQQVRAGRIEVHAFSLMTNHFHLLVYSPQGNLAEAMRQVQNGYVRYFNRRRGRDGSLFRGRFQSKLVDTEDYQIDLIHYIHANPVEAGLVKRPQDHEYGSAFWYAQGRGAPWLSRSWIRAYLERRHDRVVTSWADSAAVFAPLMSGDEFQRLELRLRRDPRRPDPLDELRTATTPAILEWFRANAWLADRGEVGVPLCKEPTVRSVLAKHSSANWPELGEEGPLRIEAGLLRDLCGATFRQLGRRCGITPGAAVRLYHRHRRSLAEDPTYGARFAELAKKCLTPVSATAPTSS
jgi:REP element-mobilizing transposase RayT